MKLIGNKILKKIIAKTSFEARTIAGVLSPIGGNKKYQCFLLTNTNERHNMIL